MKIESPVKKTKRRPLNNPYIVDKLGVLVCMCYDEEQADYIVQAINGRKKLLELLKDAQRYIRAKDPKYIEIEQILKKAGESK